MAVESAADRAAFLADFGESATLTPAQYPHPSVGKTVTLTVIFDRLYVEVGNVSGQRPVIMCLTNDLTTGGVDVGAGVTVNSVDYIVRVPEHDGTGMTMLVLEEV